jgi:hypothetical protein
MEKMTKKKPKQKSVEKVEKSRQEVSQEFELKLQQGAAEPKERIEKLDELLKDQPKKDGRGGARPGAGRPAGVTDDFAMVNRLPDKPNETIIPILQMLFDLWAASQNTPELALSKDEAKGVALPITQLLEFYWPGKVPEIIWVWLCLLGSVYGIVIPRVKILSGKKKLASVQGVSAADSAKSVAPPRQAGSVPNPDYPTTDFIKKQNP